MTDEIERKNILFTQISKLKEIMELHLFQVIAFNAVNT